MPWIRLTLECRADHVEALTTLLEQFDAIAVSTSALSTEKLFDVEPGKPSYWQRSEVSALLDAELNLDILLACAANRIGRENLVASRVEPVADRNWLNAQQQENKHAMVFSDRLCIRPSWVPDSVCEMATLVLDPGLAFGSGTHETTSMCLEWLANTNLAHKSIIDYGCGSGILGLAAALLGAGQVYAIDNDPQALRATKDNADRNGLGDRVTILHSTDPSPPAADIVVANILLDPLKQLAKLFSTQVLPGGDIVLSGLLAIQAEECISVYCNDFDMEDPVYKDEWCRLNGVRRTQ